MSYNIPNRVPLPTFRPQQNTGMMGAFPPAPAAPAPAMMQAQAQPAQGGGIRNWLGNNSEALAAMSQGLLSGRTGSEQFAQGFGGFVGAKAAGKKRTKTMEFLEQQDPLTAQAVGLGLIDGPTAFKAIYEARNKPTEYQQRAQAAQQYGIDPNTPEGRAFVLTGKLPGADGGGPKYGMNPVYLQNPDGTVSVGQLTDTGQLNPSQMPDGYQVLSPYEKSRQTSQGKAEGTVAGEAAMAAGGAEKVAADIDAQIQSIKSDPALPRVLGPIDSRTPNISEEAVRVQAKIDQIGGQAFLQARQMLKGGGAITDFESNRAEQAYIRLNQAQSEADFIAALDEFNAAVQSGVLKLRMQAGAGQRRAPQGQGRTQNGINWSLGE